jgi:hypothetical protein
MIRVTIRVSDIGEERQAERALETPEWRWGLRLFLQGSPLFLPQRTSPSQLTTYAPFWCV